MKKNSEMLRIACHFNMCLLFGILIAALTTLIVGGPLFLCYCINRWWPSLLYIVEVGALIGVGLFVDAYQTKKEREYVADR